MSSIKQSRIEKAFDFVLVVFFILLCAIMVYPFWYQICLSLSDPRLTSAGGAFLAPVGFSLNSYKFVLLSKYIWIGYRNTLFVTVGGTLIGVFLTSTIAYPLSRKTLPFRKTLNFMVVFTMMFTGGIIPTYLVVNMTGLYNNLFALILPVVINAFNVIVMRNFFSNIPEEMMESAKIDGANDICVFFKIVLPLSKAVIATISLWVAVMQWNDFFNCLIYISDRNKFVLQMILREIINSSRMSEFIELDADSLFAPPNAVKAASVMVATIPIILVYPFIQKYFVKGVMLGSVKG